MRNNPQSSEHRNSNSTTNTSGGVNINSKAGTSVGHDVVGRDKVEHVTNIYIQRNEEEDEQDESAEDRSCLATASVIGAFVFIVICAAIGLVWAANGGKAPQRQITPTPITIDSLHIEFKPRNMYAQPSYTIAPEIAPTETVRLYYQLISNKSFEDAYAMLTPAFKTRAESKALQDTGMDFKAYYSKYWGCYDSVKALNSVPKDSSDQTATVETQLELTIGSAIQIWPQTLHLIRQDASTSVWQIDRTETNNLPPNPFNCLYR
jgi:hypothetical protein